MKKLISVLLMLAMLVPVYAMAEEGFTLTLHDVHYTDTHGNDITVNPELIIQTDGNVSGAVIRDDGKTYLNVILVQEDEDVLFLFPDEKTGVRRSIESLGVDTIQSVTVPRKPIDKVDAKTAEKILRAAAESAVDFAFPETEDYTVDFVLMNDQVLQFMMALVQENGAAEMYSEEEIADAFPAEVFKGTVLQIWMEMREGVFSCDINMQRGDRYDGDYAMIEYEATFDDANSDGSHIVLEFGGSGDGARVELTMIDANTMQFLVQFILDDLTMEFAGTLNAEYCDIPPVDLSEYPEIDDSYAGYLSFMSDMLGRLEKLTEEESVAALTKAIEKETMPEYDRFDNDVVYYVVSADDLFTSVPDCFDFVPGAANISIANGQLSYGDVYFLDDQGRLWCNVIVYKRDFDELYAVTDDGKIDMDGNDLLVGIMNGGKNVSVTQREGYEFAISTYDEEAAAKWDTGTILEFVNGFTMPDEETLKELQKQETIGNGRMNENSAKRSKSKKG